MRILFIAPLPPPITGQALASRALLQRLDRHHDVTVIDFSKGSLAQGFNSPRRAAEVLAILTRIARAIPRADAVYLMLSQSLSGNLKDLLTYVACLSKLEQMIVHLHGGGIRRLIFDRSAQLRAVNRLFLKRIKGAVVPGRSLMAVFDGLVAPARIHVVPNFAADDLFLPLDRIAQKFVERVPLRVLFLSNLLEGKGYEELLEGYLHLHQAVRRDVVIDFAGAFESEARRGEFMRRIAGLDGVRYHGVVEGEQKRKLLASAHILCLPTYYRYFEGQPISILEAYASGCVVVTTDHGGIRDVFKHGVNGYQVVKESPESICETVASAIRDGDALLPLALENRRIAGERYTERTHTDRLVSLILDRGYNAP